MLIDSHCHLDFPELKADLDGVLARAHAAGVGLTLTIRNIKFHCGNSTRPPTGELHKHTRG